MRRVSASGDSHPERGGVGRPTGARSVMSKARQRGREGEVDMSGVDDDGGGIVARWT